jgi:hypothetical protein
LDDCNVRPHFGNGSARLASFSSTSPSKKE